MSNVNFNYAVDLSNNNAVPSAAGKGFDAKAYKAAGHQRIILKASQGAEEVDDYFHYWAEAAIEAGLWVSTYHFADNTAPGNEQGAHFTETIKDYPIHHRIVDEEQGSNLADPVAFRQEFGKAADLLYSDEGYLEQYGQALALGDEPVWVAAFPNLTGGWWSHRVWGHQYAENARVKGIANPCDISILL